MNTLNIPIAAKPPTSATNQSGTRPVLAINKNPLKVYNYYEVLNSLVKEIARK
jgi:hypothetical protein